MLARVNTIAFNGLNTLDVDLQLQITSGLPAFNIVGLPDKTIAESRLNNKLEKNESCRITISESLLKERTL